MKKVLIAILCIIVVIPVLLFGVLFYCLDRTRIPRQFEKCIVNQDGIWKAKEIDCALYGKKTEFYQELMKRYDVDMENADYLVGILKMEDEEIPVMFEYSGPGSGACFSQVYSDSETRTLQSYQHMQVWGNYSLKWGKRTMEYKVDESMSESGKNKLEQYLSDNNIEQITFVKTKMPNTELPQIQISEETNQSLFDLYDKDFGVNVLSAKYVKKKKRMEIVVHNTLDYDLDKTDLEIAIKGKGLYDLGEWKYNDILPPEDYSYEVGYEVEEIIKANSKKKILIEDIEDDEILEIRAIVEAYEKEETYFQNYAMIPFSQIIDEEYSEFMKELYRSGE